MILKWLICTVVVLLVLCLGFCTSGLHGAATRDDLGALAGIVEVAIGISAAFVALDRFRLHRRLETRAKSLMKKTVAGDDILRFARGDGKVNKDEKNVLAVFDLIGNEKVREYCAGNPQVRKSAEFNKSFSGVILILLLRWRVDRSIAIVLLALLCGWEFTSQVWQLPDTIVFAHLPPARIVTPVLYAAALGLVVPALSYVLSELALNGAERYLTDNLESIATTMSREPVNDVKVKSIIEAIDEAKPDRETRPARPARARRASQ